MTKSRQNPLRILLTNHHLLSYQGSEIFTLIIAEFLVKNGHHVSVYSAYVGKLRKDFEKIGAQVVSHLALLQNQEFDIAHVHHHINAYEVRYYFPHLPIVLLCHGVVFLENPPPLDLKISQYLAVSERVKKCMMDLGVEESKISIFRNIIDSEKFYPRSEVSIGKASCVLVLSNNIDLISESVIRKACRILNMQCIFVGKRFGRVKYTQIPRILNRADMVVTLGRGAIEAMFCGRIPIVFDHKGGDGMVTFENMTEMMKSNFSGTLYNQHYSVEEFINILKCYSDQNPKKLREKALEYFSAEKQIHALIDIYYEQVDKNIELLSAFERQILASFVSSVVETRAYTTFYHEYQKSIRLRSFCLKILKSFYHVIKNSMTSLYSWSKFNYYTYKRYFNLMR